MQKVNMNQYYVASLIFSPLTKKMNRKYEIGFSPLQSRNKVDEKSIWDENFGQGAIRSKKLNLEVIFWYNIHFLILKE